MIGRIAKWSAAVPSADRLPELARKALRKSFEGRPGVVHLDVPETIMNGKLDAVSALWPPAKYRPQSPREIVRDAQAMLRPPAPATRGGCSR